MLLKLFKRWVLQEGVKDLFNTLGKNDILEEKDGKWIISGKEVTDAEKKTLIAEAQSFTRMRLWKVLQADVKYKANKLMYEQSKSEMDLIAGKLWLYTLDCFRTRLESLDKGKGNLNNP